ncbi:hypothetical protein GCM10009682_61690 [Luedemannella flava]|uniref:DUF2690 domain-containing protein n=1 Tax=Luedemannella flava TaxID=349316 RepID=A0ABN2MRA6_9ACTN
MKHVATGLTRAVIAVAATATVPATPAAASPPYLGEDPFQSGCVAGSVAAPTSESPDGHLRMTDPRSNTYVGDAQLLHTPKCAGFWMLVVFNPQYRVDPAMSVEGVVDPALVGPSSLAPGNGAVWSFVLRGMERDNACADVGVTNQNGQHVATFNLGCTGQPPPATR